MDNKTSAMVRFKKIIDKIKAGFIKIAEKINAGYNKTIEVLRKIMNILLIILGALLIVFGLFTILFLDAAGINFSNIMKDGLINLIWYILGPLNIIWGILLICLRNSKKWQGLVFLGLNITTLTVFSFIGEAFCWPLIPGVIIPLLYAIGKIIKYRSKIFSILLIILGELLVVFGVFTILFLDAAGINFSNIMKDGLINFIWYILGPLNIIWGILLICMRNSKKWQGIVFLGLNIIAVTVFSLIGGAFCWPLIPGVIIPLLYAIGKIIKYKTWPKSGKGTIYVVCAILVFLSLIPFVIMIVNATRNTPEIQQHAISFNFSSHFAENWGVLSGKDFDPLVGFINSLLIATGATVLAIYFSTLTAYALFAYNWRLRQPFFTMIMVVMMIPAQITAIGFYQFMFQLDKFVGANPIHFPTVSNFLLFGKDFSFLLNNLAQMVLPTHMSNNLLALILPAIAAPMTVFFMRQYMLSSVNLDIVASARIDGAGEFKIFNKIILPIMKPAMATQAIFTFVFNWNNLFIPMILLSNKDVKTMPIMVSLLKGDIYRIKYGAVYLAIGLSVLPLFIIYFILSRYIIAGVALGSIKE